MAKQTPSRVILLDNGDILTDEMTHKCGTPLTDKFVFWMERMGRLTTDEAISYHRQALRLNVSA